MKTEELQLLSLFAGLRPALLSGLSQSLLEGLCFSFEMLPKSSQLPGQLLTLHLHLHAYKQIRDGGGGERGLSEICFFRHLHSLLHLETG
ncbi:hypothetical protein EYF80_025475 [Liparis tanakae]|uniref:Uncharacterized protein n=1 Tax=Liparis tanakae TaxID=230148 RepID=A0A4Z2HGH7_9TELE|nr:hypothetical protein EYF80_025475 [Liparis tanakae]